MKILVCVKQVLDPGGITVNRKAEKVFINREEFILDPASKAALEAANDLKQAGAASHVIAISVGPEICSARLTKLTAVKKTGAFTVKKMVMAIIAMITGRLPSSPALSRSR